MQNRVALEAAGRSDAMTSRQRAYLVDGPLAPDDDTVHGWTTDSRCRARDEAPRGDGLTRADAEALIDSYCDDPAPDGAVDRLLASALTRDDLARLGRPGSSRVQDAVDEAIYGGRQGETR